MAYLMGIIDKTARGGFHTIREIRNRFAHRLDLDDFNSPIVHKLCNKLFRPDPAKRLLEQVKETFSKADDSEPVKQALIMVRRFCTKFR